MLDFIERLRKKPVAYRKRFLFLSTSIITGIIFIFWLLSFNANMDIDEVDSLALEKQLRPIDEIQANIADFYSLVKKIGNDIFGGNATTSPEQLP
ncbi:MAG: hypothetical protein UW34_C0010G0006 [Parcubacteria group bacterium GW2011_GWA2_44_15]|nr:MAG: hypothetical protein UW34_C0010G0006 [Parcubacteria group bacterium GW2011_GWA2_44_15]